MNQDLREDKEGLLNSRLLKLHQYISLFIFLLFTSVNADGAVTDTTTTGANGHGTVFAPCTEILRFDNYNDATAGAPTGQSFVFTLASGDSLFLVLKKSGDPIVAVNAPSWVGSAFGNLGYSGLAGKVVLYQLNTGSNSVLLFDNIVVKDKAGNVIPDYTLVLFDGESTSQLETITISAPPGSVFYDWDSIVPTGSYSVPPETGIGTNVVAWSDPGPPYTTYNLARSVAIHSPPSLSVSMNHGTTGYEGIAIGIKRIIVSPDITRCRGGAITINPVNAPAGTTYTWTAPVVTPAGSITGGAAQTTPVTSIQQLLTKVGNGNDTITYQITPNACGILDTPFIARIVIGSGPSVSITPVNPNICLGDSTTLTAIATVAGGVFSWSPGGASTSSIQVAPQTTTTYSVTYSLSGCTSSASDVVNVGVGSASNFLGADTVYCSPFTRTLSTGIASTKWSTGDSAAQITVSTPGLYWARVSGGCGTGIDSILIAEGAPPTTIGNDTTYCGAFWRVLY
ncbi:MAG: Conserved repeat domain protein, partial [Bacteroidota bacterium]|nr:Conserved repeat domain protein [Bacteroidota bacterium]